MQETLGKRIAEARSREGFTQKELAKRAGLSIPFISEVENNKRKPGANSLLCLSDALGVSMDFLMRGEEKGEDHRKSDYPLSIPPSLDRAAREEDWSYEDVKALLKGSKGLLARRSSKVHKTAEEYTAADWKKLYRLREEFIRGL